MVMCKSKEPISEAVNGQVLPLLQPSPRSLIGKVPNRNGTCPLRDRNGNPKMPLTVRKQTSDTKEEGADGDEEEMPENEGSVRCLRVVPLRYICRKSGIYHQV